MANLILGTPGYDGLFGEDGDDVVRGGAGDDWISGGPGNDTLGGGDGYDRVSDGGGSDICWGDHIIADIFDPLGNDWYIAGSEHAKIYWGSNQSLVINLSAGWAHGTEIGQDVVRGFTDTAGATGNDKIIGNVKDNELQGGEGDDWIGGRAGRDWIEGDAGDDWLRGGGGNDKLFSGEGNDTVAGGKGKDQIAAAGSQSALLYGGAGNDVIHDSQGNDTIFGGDGNDTIEAGAGRETMNGGAGSDRFIVNFIHGDPNHLHGPDLIVDFEDGIDKLGRSIEAAIQVYGRDTSDGLVVENFYTPGLLLVMRGVTLAQIDASDFV